MWQTAAQNLSLLPLNVALSCFHLTLKHGHTNLLSTALIFEFIHYPYPSASINQPVTAPCPQPHTQAATHTHTQTPKLRYTSPPANRLSVWFLLACLRR